MQTQTIFKAGNSEYVVTIPKALAEEINLKRGEKVEVDKTPDGEVIIRRVTKAKGKKTLVSNEFKKWLKEVLIEDAEILDELAVR